MTRIAWFSLTCYNNFTKRMAENTHNCNDTLQKKLIKIHPDVTKC